MSIATEITRLNNAKASIKSAIENKGVTVPSSTKLDGYASLVSSIPGIVPTGTINITENGENIDVKQYAKANVNVQAAPSKPEFELWDFDDPRNYGVEGYGAGYYTVYGMSKSGNDYTILFTNTAQRDDGTDIDVQGVQYIRVFQTIVYNTSEHPTFTENDVYEYIDGNKSNQMKGELTLSKWENNGLTYCQLTYQISTTLVTRTCALTLDPNYDMRVLFTIYQFVEE